MRIGHAFGHDQPDLPKPRLSSLAVGVTADAVSPFLRSLLQRRSRLFEARLWLGAGYSYCMGVPRFVRRHTSVQAGIGDLLFGAARLLHGMPWRGRTPEAPGSSSDVVLPEHRRRRRARQRLRALSGAPPFQEFFLGTARLPLDLLGAAHRDSTPGQRVLASVRKALAAGVIRPGSLRRTFAR